MANQPSTNDAIYSTLQNASITEESGAAIVARLLLEGCPDATKTNFDDIMNGDYTLPLTEQTILKKHKFAVSQILKVLQMTFNLHVLFNSKTGKANDDVWFLEEGRFVKYSASAAANQPKENKISKNDINSIRTFYEDILAKDIPRVIHKIYVEFMSVRGNFSYNANEVKLVFVDKDYRPILLFQQLA